MATTYTPSPNHKAPAGPERITGQGGIVYQVSREGTSKSGVDYCSRRFLAFPIAQDDEGIFVNLVGFNAEAAALSKLERGTRVVVKGTVKTETYTARDGSQGQSTSILLDRGGLIIEGPPAN